MCSRILHNNVIDQVLALWFDVWLINLDYMITRQPLVNYITINGPMNRVALTPWFIHQHRCSGQHLRLTPSDLFSGLHRDHQQFLINSSTMISVSATTQWGDNAVTNAFTITPYVTVGVTPTRHNQCHKHPHKSQGI